MTEPKPPGRATDEQIAIKARHKAIRRMRSSRAYTALSRKIRAKYPICQVCGVRASVECHHLIGLAEPGGLELALEPSNCQAVCKSCHMEIHDKPPPGKTEKEGGTVDHKGGAKFSSGNDPLNDQNQESNPWKL